jgi:hypothetical protein
VRAGAGLEVLRAAVTEIERGGAPAMARLQGRPSFDWLSGAQATRITVP